MSKIITRIKGGLGNQLFCYAAARRLALINNSELVIDDVTGFARDLKYQRQYALDHFNIPIPKATPSERLEPFERYRRAVIKLSSRRKPFSLRRYIEQVGNEYDGRLLTLKVSGMLYLDGYWQSEDYFKDVEQIIREDLRIIPPQDKINQSLAEDISKRQSVALHIRWFDLPGGTNTHNASVDYYRRAIEFIESKLDAPHYYIFSDDPVAARNMLDLPKENVTYISHNKGDEHAYADLWLMTQCRHFITANSTFSWWGAWLGKNNGKIVVCPGMNLGYKAITAWNFPGQIPDEWLKI